MEIYVIGEVEYDLSSWEQSEKDEWLEDHPDAKPKAETSEDFTNGVAGTDATVTPEEVAPNGESNSETTFSDVPEIPKQIGSELDGVDFDDIQRRDPLIDYLNKMQKGIANSRQNPDEIDPVLENKNDKIDEIESGIKLSNELNAPAEAIKEEIQNTSIYNTAVGKASETNVEPSEVVSENGNTVEKNTNGSVTVTSNIGASQTNPMEQVNYPANYNLIWASNELEEDALAARLGENVENLDLEDLRARWTQDSGKNERQIIVDKGENPIEIASAEGKKFLTPKQQNLSMLERKLQNAIENGESPEALEKIQLQIDFSRKDVAGTGTQLYDPKTNDLVNASVLSAEGKELEESAQGLSFANDLERLRDNQATDYYELMAIAKESLNKIDLIGDDRSTFEVIGGAFRQMFTKDTYYDDIDSLKQIVESGKLPAKIMDLPGGHVLAEAFNKKFVDFVTTSRAIEINTDPATEERTNLFTKNLNRLSKNVTGKDFLNENDKDRAVELFKESIELAGMKYDDTNMIEERTKETLADATLGMTVDLIPLIGTIIVAKKLPGAAAAARGLEGISKFLKVVGPKTGLYRTAVNTLFGLNSGSSVVKEIATLGIADKIGENLIGAEPVDVVFAGSLGGGQSLAQQAMNSKLLKGLGKRFRTVAPVIGSLMTKKQPVKIAQALNSGVIGTATMVVAEAVQIEYDSLMEEGKFAEGEELLALGTTHHLLSTFYSLTLVGQGGKLFAKNVKNDIKALRPFSKNEIKKAENVLLDNGAKVPFEGDIKGNAAEIYSSEGKKDYELEISKSKDKALDNLKKKYKAQNDGKPFNIADGEYTKDVKKIEAASRLLIDNYNLKIAKVAIKTDEEIKKNNPKWKQRFVTKEKIINERYDELNAKDWESINNTDVQVFIDNLGATTPAARQNALNIHKQASQIINQVNSLGVKNGTSSYAEAINIVPEYQANATGIELFKKEAKNNPGSKLQFDIEIKKLEKRNQELETRWKELNEETTEATIKEIETTRKVFIESGVKNSKTLTSEEFKAKQKELGYEIDPNASALVNRKTGEVFIDIELAGKQRARGIEVHEQVHNAVMGSLRNAKGEISPQGKVILKDFIKGLAPSVRKKVRERIEKDYKFDEKGKEKAFEEYGEEYATAYGDLIRDGIVKVVEPTGEVNVGKITTGAELMNSIRKINLQVTEGGKLSSDIVSAIKSKKGSGDGVSKSRNVEKIKNLESELRIVKSEEASRRQSMLDRAKEIEKDQPKVAKRMRDAVDNMTNKEGVLIRDIADQYNVVIENTLLKLIKKNPALLKTPTYQEYNTQAEKIQAIIKQTTPEIIKHIERFDFKKNDNLDAYINSYVERKIGTATSQKGFRKTEFTSDLENAKNIAAEKDALILDNVSEQSKFKIIVKPTNVQRVKILQKSVNTLIKNLNKINTDVKGKPRAFYSDAKKEVSDQMFKLVKDNLNTLNKKGYRALMNTKQGVEAVYEIDLQTMTNSLKGVGKDAKGGFRIFLEPVLKADGTQAEYNKKEANELGIPYDKAGSGLKKWKKKSINDFVDKDGVPSAEFLDWVLDRKNSIPRIDGKKDAISKALAANLGLDALMSGAKNSTIKTQGGKDIDLLENATETQKTLIKTDAFLSNLGDIIKRNPNVSFNISKETQRFMGDLKKIPNVEGQRELFEKLSPKLKTVLDGLVGEGKTVLSEIDKIRLNLETEAIDRIMVQENLTFDQVMLRINQDIKNYDGLRKEKKTENKGNDAEVQKRMLQGLIPEGMKLGDLSKDVQQFFYSELMGGNIRFIVDGKKITAKQFTKELQDKLFKEGRDWETPKSISKTDPTKDNLAPKESTYADLFEVAYGKEAIVGIKPMSKNKDGSSKIDAVKFYSNWGESGVSGKIESIATKNIKEYGDTSKARKEIKKEIEKYMTKEGVDSKGNPLYTIDQTQAANRYLLERKYDVLVDMFIEKPTTKMLGKIIDALQPLTNQATSISKGAIPLTLVNIFSKKGPKYNEKGKELKQEKIRHNEHLLEFFQMNKRFVDLLSDYQSKKITEAELRQKTIDLLKEAEQASTSEFQRYGKDKNGPAVSSALSTIEFLFKDGKAKDVVTIGSSRDGLTLAEATVKALTPKQKRIILDTPSNKLNAEGVMVKQRIANVKDYKKVETNNQIIAEKAGISKNRSTKMNQGELFETLKNIDKNNAEKIKNEFNKKDLSKEFNVILEQSSGVESVKEFSDIRARTIGAKKRNWQLFIPDSAADLNGLIDVTLGKGKKGDAQRKWYKENVIEPFTRAEDALTRDRVALTSGFKALKKQLKIIPKDLRKEAVDGFTYEQAIRVHIWNKQGMKVEGLSKRDLKELNDIVEKNPELQAFADQLIQLNKGEGYPPPGREWLASTLATDLRTGLNKEGRAKYLEATGYTENINKIYSKENLNKLEALYGTKYRTALENMLGRMKTGKNRKPSSNELENRAMDWINNANGVTMFLNARSSVLQTISSMNYINWTDNNPIKAGKAIADQPQFWKDFMEIMNSDYLVDRRNGLKLNVSESEIADAAKTATNSAKGAINYLLSKGYVFTRIADSFAIASGGSTMYRNRINTYKKQGLTEAEAKEKAFRDFKEISEESQQSANVSKISMEQASTLGRLVLAFANTPMQYTRLQKRAILDLANGRGDYKTNVSKIAYYGFVQNLLFNAMQNALFTNIWEDEPDESKEETKRIRIANGMLDSTLRGMGIGGALVSTVKNVMLKIKSESEKSRPQYKAAALEVFDFLPAIDTKIRKLTSAGRSFEWNADDMKYMSLMDIDNPAYLAGANIISAATNFPADRIVKKITNMHGVMTDEMEMWQRIFRFAGWSEWEIGPQKFEPLKPKRRKGGLTTGLPTISLPTISLPKF